MSQPPLLERLGILADAAKYDASCASSGTAKRTSKGGKGIGSTEGMGICHAYQSPTAKEIDVCRWWVESERDIVKPQLVLALGASAARGMPGKTVSVQKERSRAHLLEDGTELWITTHPSYLLRLQDDARTIGEKRFAEDLRSVAARLAELA
jgi:uracil-DNA glycosylase